MALAVSAACLLAAVGLAIALIRGRELPAVVVALPPLVCLVVVCAMDADVFSSPVVEDILQGVARTNREWAALFAARYAHGLHALALLGGGLATLVLLAGLVAASIGEERRSFGWALPVLVVGPTLGVPVQLAWQAPGGPESVAWALGPVMGIYALALALAALAATDGSPTRGPSRSVAVLLVLTTGLMSVLLAAGLNLPDVRVHGGAMAIVFWSALALLLVIGRSGKPADIAGALAGLVALGSAALTPEPDVQAARWLAAQVVASGPAEGIELPPLTRHRALGLVRAFSLSVGHADDLPVFEQALADERRMLDAGGTVGASGQLLLHLDAHMPTSTAQTAVELARGHGFGRVKLGGIGPAGVSGIWLDSTNRRSELVLALHDKGYLLVAAPHQGYPGFVATPNSPGRLLPCSESCLDGYPDDALVDALAQLGGRNKSVDLVVPGDRPWAEAFRVIDLLGENQWSVRGLDWPAPPTSPDGAPAHIHLETLGGPNWPPAEAEPSDTEGSILLEFLGAGGDLGETTDVLEPRE